MLSGRCAFRDEIDAFAEQAAKHLVHPFHHIGEIEHARLQNLFSAESEELACEACGTFTGFLDLCHGAGLGAADFHAVQGDVTVADDCGQDVIEVMRDAASELPKCLDFLRLAKLFLELPLFSDIAAVEDDATHSRVIQQVVPAAFEDAVAFHHSHGSEN